MPICELSDTCTRQLSRLLISRWELPYSARHASPAGRSKVPSCPCRWLPTPEADPAAVARVAEAAEAVEVVAEAVDAGEEAAPYATPLGLGSIGPKYQGCPGGQPFAPFLIPLPGTGLTDCVRRTPKEFEMRSERLTASLHFLISFGESDFLNTSGVPRRGFEMRSEGLTAPAVYPGTR